MSKAVEKSAIVNETKRVRCKNFLEEEKENLLIIAQRYQSIIENKRTDAVWTSEKNKAWEEIAASFNPKSKTGIRTGAQLKLLFDGMKKNAKKRKADDKVELYKTGGGPAPVSQLTDADNKIIAMLGPQMEPLLNAYDCNADFNVGNSEIISEDTVLLDLDVVDVLPEKDLTVICNNPASVVISPDHLTDKVSLEPRTVPKTKSWKSSFVQRVKDKQIGNKFATKGNDHKDEIFTMKRIKHEKQMAILEIIQKKEQAELEIKLLELEMKKKSVNI